MEVSHGELQKYHYQAIRDNPMYRLEWQIEELRIQQEPPWYQPEETLEERLSKLEERMGEYISSHPLPPELRSQLQQLKGRFIHLQNKYNEHMDKPKKDTSYIYNSISKGDSDGENTSG